MNLQNTENSLDEYRVQINYSNEFKSQLKSPLAWVMTKRYSIPQMLHMRKSPACDLVQINDQWKTWTEVDNVYGYTIKGSSNTNGNGGNKKAEHSTNSHHNNNNNKNNNLDGSIGRNSNNNGRNNREGGRRRQNQEEYAPKHFDMEKFKEEMKKKDGIITEPVAAKTPGSGKTSPRSPILSQEPDFEMAMSEAPVSGRTESRFGGKFFRLTDDGEPSSTSTTTATSILSALSVAQQAQDQSASLGSSLMNRQQISPTSNSTFANTPSTNTTEALKSSSLPEPAASNSVLGVTSGGKKKIVAFDTGVPTSVIRKLSSSTDARLEITPEKRKPLQQPSGLSQQQQPFMAPVIPEDFKQMPQPPPPPPQVFTGPQFPPLPPLPGQIPQQMAMDQPVVHYGPDGQRMELPPPHVFVQMLLANNLPIPPEFYPFLPPNPPPQSQHLPQQLPHLQQQQASNDNVIFQKLFGASSTKSSPQSSSTSPTSSSATGKVYTLSEIENNHA